MYNKHVEDKDATNKNRKFKPKESRQLHLLGILNLNEILKKVKAVNSPGWQAFGGASTTFKNKKILSIL